LCALPCNHEGGGEEGPAPITDIQYKDQAQASKANDDAEAAIKEFNDLAAEVNQRQAAKEE
jgi:benzoyl-CoA reductase/2-hydroxyglutaryl-CoA dehydratase subunit BcrC/BadD/HgdB